MLKKHKKNITWYKFKTILFSIILFITLNLYLIYIISRYITDQTTASLLILISNESFIFIGMLLYIHLINKKKVDTRLEELEYIIKNK